MRSMPDSDIKSKRATKSIKPGAHYTHQFDNRASYVATRTKCSTSRRFKNHFVNEYEQTNKHHACSTASSLQRRDMPMLRYYKGDDLPYYRAALSEYLPRLETPVCFLKHLTRKNYHTSFALRHVSGTNQFTFRCLRLIVFV